jgi:hypothetical protein
MTSSGSAMHMGSNRSARSTPTCIARSSGSWSQTSCAVLGHATARRWTAIQGNGKTTIVSHFGRQYERRCRERYPHELTTDGHEYLPVVYANVDALPTIKGLNHAILTFYGMGPRKRSNARELTQLVLECARCCQTSLVVPGTDVARGRVVRSC